MNGMIRSTRQTGRGVLRRYCGILLCLVLLFSVWPAPVSARAAETKPQTVRVGWYEDSYHITGVNGGRSGYAYEYEQALAGYTGWNYEYVKGDFSELLGKLANGEIDLMAAISYTDERAKTMLFSELPMGEEKYYLYADLTNASISTSDLSTLNDKKIIVMEDSIQATQFSEWEKEHHIKTQHVNIDSIGRAMKLTEKHEVDGVISTETPIWVEAGMSAIATTGGSGIYYAINKNRPDLKEALDNAMRSMEYDKPFYSDDLYKQYLAAESVAVLSNEEKDWLAEHGAIRVGLLKEDNGVSKYDEETGTYTGVINDYVNYATDCLGNHALNFELTGFDSQDEEVQALKDGTIDLIFHAAQNPSIAEDNGFSLSNTVWSTTLSALTTKSAFDETAENTVAVPKNRLALKWYISYEYPQWKILETDTFADAQKAVRSGDADCFVVRSSLVANYIKDIKFHSFSLMQPDNISFAVSRGNKTLLSILNKTLKSMPSSMLTGALFTYDNMSRKVTLMDFIKDNLLVVTTLLLAIFLIILLPVLASLKRSQLAETKAKEAAAQARELNRKLQESQKDLKVALLQAESANSAKTTFLNNISTISGPR